ncbi:thiamine diphosphokinase [Caviibacter abscessus]|uniref:thiamine diphosphokinase n=1 Tax=Caviibacter abscessus TaxID=1766719 RepID=UPI00082E32E1|nr:thiamine diphosphokinase [Caviibacter abscessus]
MKYAIFLNGEYPKLNEYHFNLIKNRFIYCCDGAANTLIKYNIKPDIIIGDFDSIDKKAWEYYKNTKMYKYDSDKDYTDFEIALIHIYGINNINIKNRFNNCETYLSGKEDIIVFGATGYRTDMTISNLKLLEKNKNMKFISHTNELIYYINNKSTIYDMKNHIFSLIPITDIKNLSLKGFKYNLKNKNIERQISLVSNIIESNSAEIELNGEALVFIKK